MRIANIVEYLHRRGGTQRQAIELARGLERRGHHVVTVTRFLDHERCYPHLLAGLELEAVLSRGPRRLVSKNSRISRWSELRQMLVNSGIMSLVELAKMVRGARSLEERMWELHSAHSFDAVIAHDFGPASWASAAFAHRARLPCLWQCNDPIYRWNHDALSLAERLVRRAVVIYDSAQVRSIGGVAVLDTSVQRTVEARFGRSATVVRSGVDVERFSTLSKRIESKQRWDIPAEAVVIAAVTQLDSPHRRVEDLLHAHEECNRAVWLLLAAPRCAGRYSDAMVRAIEASPVNARIRWIDRDFEDESEFLSVFEAADIFVFPNVDQTWGLAPIEAAASGLPVVISDGAGSHEVFEHGVTGVVVEGGSVEQIRCAVEQLAADPALRERMGRQARKWAISTFSWDRYAGTIEEMLADMTTFNASPLWCEDI